MEFSGISSYIAYLITLPSSSIKTIICQRRLPRLWRVVASLRKARLFKMSNENCDSQSPSYSGDYAVPTVVPALSKLTGTLQAEIVALVLCKA